MIHVEPIHADVFLMWQTLAMMSQPLHITLNCPIALDVLPMDTIDIASVKNKDGWMSRGASCLVVVTSYDSFSSGLLVCSPYST